MHPILAFAQAKQPEIIAFIRQLVECESPSGEAAAVNRFVDLLSERVAGYAVIKTIPAGKYGRHARFEFSLPGLPKEGQILALGHSDTVWPLGTLAGMPFREAEGRLWGPGVLDMKAGIAFFVFAIEALRKLEIPVRRRVVLLVNADEEVGSLSSRPLTEQTARESQAVLVLEPGTGLGGKLKTSRKGVGGYTVTVKGRAAHAGVDFKAGASAVVELAHQIGRIARFSSVRRGVTVNPGVISGGTRSNVIAAEARVEVDIRVPKLKQAAVLDAKFKALKPHDKRCSIQIEGGLNRPPMEPSTGGRALFEAARKAGRQIGEPVSESATGGGSDGNFTAALGIPTLDGLGAVGEGAHALNESILIDRIAGRTALLALLLAGLDTGAQLSYLTKQS